MGILIYNANWTKWSVICIGNSMICSDIWHKYHKWYFELLDKLFWNITSGIYTKYHIPIILLFVYTTTRNSFVIFTCRYFKLSWNTTALSQSNCRNFSCSSIRSEIICMILLWVRFEIHASNKVRQTNFTDFSRNFQGQITVFKD